MPVFTAPTRFTGLSLYAVLGVQQSATTDDIKRGYRRAALKYHPDHNHSPDANDEFAYLAHAHDVLSHPSTRTLYDETGTHDTSGSAVAGGSGEVSSAEYWRSVFPQVSVAEIEEFRGKYVGSDEEVADVVATYERYEGNVQHVLDAVPYADADSVPRLCALLNQHCRARITAAQQRRLQRQAEQWQRREEAEFERLAVAGSVEEKEAAAAAGDMTQLVALLTRRKEEAKHKQEQWLSYMTDKYGSGGDSKRKRLTSGTAAGKRKGGGKGKAEAEADERKEGSGGDEEEVEGGDEPSEEEFQRIQAELMKRREANRANGSSSSTAAGKKAKGSTERDKKRRKTSK